MHITMKERNKFSHCLAMHRCYRIFMDHFPVLHAFVVMYHALGGPVLVQGKIEARRSLSQPNVTRRETHSYWAPRVAWSLFSVPGSSTFSWVLKTVLQHS